MVELVDTLVSGTSVRKDVQVRVLFSALMEAATLFYYTSTVFLIVILLIWLVIGIQVYRVLNSARKGIEEAKSVAKAEMWKKALAVGGMMIAGKLVNELKKKFESSSTRD